MKSTLKYIITIAAMLALFSGHAFGATVCSVFQGCTGTGSITGIVQGNGTSPFTHVTIGSGLDFTGGTLSATGGSTPTLDIVATAGATTSLALQFPELHFGALSSDTGFKLLVDASQNIFLSSYSAVPSGNSGTIIFGSNAGLGSDGASYSIFFGDEAGKNSPVTSSNFFGISAGKGAPLASSSNFFGSYAGQETDSGDNSNFFGTYAGYQANNLSNSNFFSQGAGQGSYDSGYSNFFGISAGQNASGSFYSNFYGPYAGYGASSPYANMFGYQSGYGASAQYSNFFGYNAGYQAYGSSNTIAIGKNALNGTALMPNAIVIGDGAGSGDSANYSSVSHAPILIGSNTSANSYSDSAAFGHGAANSAANQMYFADYLTNWNIAGVNYSMPASNASGVMTNDGSGNLTWAASTGGVTSFNTRTGAVTLLSSDVTGALGFTPYNATNPSNYISRSGVSATSPLLYNSTTGVFTIQQSSGSQAGYLSSSDWTTFNNKGSGTVTSVTAGTGLSGGTITATGTISLANTAVTPGAYTSADITVDAQGRITAAANGSGGGVTGSGTAGQATFWTGTSTVSSDAGFAWDNTNKALTVSNAGNTSAPLNITRTSGNYVQTASDLAGRSSIVITPSAFSTQKLYVASNGANQLLQGYNGSATSGILLNPFGGGVSVGGGVPQNNTSAFQVTDTSLSGSGSLSGGLASFAQTWNTTGNPTAFKMNITDTASGSTSKLLDLQRNSSSVVSVGKYGGMNIDVSAAPSSVVGLFVKQSSNGSSAITAYNDGGGNNNYTFISTGNAGFSTYFRQSGQIGIGQALPTSQIMVGTGLQSSTSSSSVWGTAGIGLNWQALTYTDSNNAGGTIAQVNLHSFGIPTFTNPNAITYTNAANVYIAGAPVAAGSVTITNPYSLQVASGLSRFSGSSLTGSQATGILTLDQTWNTTGTPTAFSVAVTNTSSNSSSKLFDFKAGGAGTTSLFSMTASGNMTAGWGSLGGYLLTANGSGGYPGLISLGNGQWSTVITGTANQLFSVTNSASSTMINSAGMTNSNGQIHGGISVVSTNATPVAFTANLNSSATLGRFFNLNHSSQTYQISSPNNIKLVSSYWYTSGVFGSSWNQVETNQFGSILLDNSNGGSSSQLAKSGFVWSTTVGSTLAEAMRLDGSNLGIGVTSTSAKLDIADTALAGSGSLAGSIVNLAQTWNTSGNPTAISLNVTNTASGSSSKLIDIKVAGISQFNVGKTGILTALGSIISGGVVRTAGYTVATLPAGTQGDRAYVTDALAPTFLGVLAGGGTVVTPVFYNGSAWVAN